VFATGKLRDFHDVFLSVDGDEVTHAERAHANSTGRQRLRSRTLEQGAGADDCAGFDSVQRAAELE